MFCITRVFDDVIITWKLSAAQQIVDTVKDVCSQNINFIDEKGLSEDALCRVVIVRLNVRYNPNNLFMIQSAITQALRS